MITEVFLRVLLAAFMVASVSFTITQTSMFAFLRRAVEATGIHKLEELIHCPYCIGHWITFVSLLVLGPDFLIPVSLWNNIFVPFFATAFAIMGMVGIMHYVMLRTYEPVAKQQAKRELARLKQQATEERTDG